VTREQKLSEYIIGRINTPLVWGVSDCCLFVADALHAMTGKDIASWFRGEYSTRGKAFEMLRKFAGGSVKETVEELARVFEMDKITADIAMQPGDMVLLRAAACDPVAERLSNGLTVGIVGFDDIGILSQGKDGLVIHTDAEVLSAWRI